MRCIRGGGPADLPARGAYPKGDSTNTTAGGQEDVSLGLGFPHSHPYNLRSGYKRRRVTLKEAMEPAGFRPAATKDLVLHLQPRGRQTYPSASDAFGSRGSVCPWLTRIALGRQPGSSTLSSGVASPAEGPWGPLNHTSQGSQMDLAEL